VKTKQSSRRAMVVGIEMTVLLDLGSMIIGSLKGGVRFLHAADVVRPLHVVGVVRLLRVAGVVLAHVLAPVLDRELVLVAGSVSQLIPLRDL
jgi:hypothetical protein